MYWKYLCYIYKADLVAEMLDMRKLFVAYKLEMKTKYWQTIKNCLSLL